MSAPLRLEREGSIARLVIDRAQKKNAFNQEMWDSFPVLLSDAMADPAVRALVLQSAAPGAFSAGADIGAIRKRGVNENAQSGSDGLKER